MTMNDSASVDPRLRSILSRVFADGVLEASERAELQAIWREAKLTLPVVRATFTDFLRAELASVLEDGKVTEEEREKLRTIVRELKIPPSLVPEEVTRAIG